MSRAMPTGVVALLEGVSRAHHQRVWIGPPGGALIDLTDYLIPGTVQEEGINEPVDMLILHFDRSLGSSSLSPLMTEDPPIDLNFDVVWEVAVTSLTASPSSGDWIEKFRGSVWDIDATHNDMVVTCEGLMGKLRERLTLAGQTIEAGTELPAAIQAVLDGPTPSLDLTLWTPVDPDASLNEDLAVQHGPVLQAALGLAGSIGWSFRYWWNEADEEFQPALLEPPRDKTVADWSTSASRYIAVPEFRRSKADVKNFVTVYYGPTDGDGNQAFVIATDAASVTAFGLQEAIFREGSDSPLQSAVQAQAFADAFISDMAWPDITHSITDFDLPNIELWDLIELAANDVHYNTTQRYAVQSIRREFPTMGAARITLGLRGKPSAGVGTWKRRQTTASPQPDQVTYGFREWYEVPTGDPAVRRFFYEAGSQVSEVWAASRLYTAELAEGADPPEEDIKLYVEPMDDTSGYVEIDRPRADQVSILRVEPRVWVGDNLVVFDNGVNLIRQVVWYPEPAIINGFIDAVESSGVVAVAVSANPSAPAVPVAWEVWEGTKTGTMLASGAWSTQALAQAGETSASVAGLGGRSVPATGKKTWFAKFTDAAGNVEWHSDTVGAPRLPMFSGVKSVLSSDLLSVDIYGVVSDPYPIGGTLYYWLPADVETPADPAGAATGSYAVTAVSLPLSFGPSQIAAFNDFAIAGSSFAVFLEYVAADGRTTGRQKFVLESSMQFLIDSLGKLRAGSVHNALVLAQQFRPYFFADDFAALSLLTPDDTETNLAFTVDTLTPYIWDEVNSEWDVQADVPAVGFNPILRAGIVTAEVLDAAAVRAKLVGAERITADNVNIGSLSLIATDAGAIVSGSFVNGDSSAGLDLDATGTEPVLWAPGLEIQAGGAATFGGDLDAVNGTLDTLTVESSGHVQSSDYDPGVAGWRIDGAGDAEFNSVTIRDEVNKTMRIPNTSFSPVAYSQEWVMWSSGISPVGATSGDFLGSVVLPRGAVITGFRARLFRNGVTDAASATLRSVSESGVATPIAFVDHNDVGYKDMYSSVANVEVDDESHFNIASNLLNDAATGDARLLWVEVEYTVENYRQTL